jgi:hypothetical protein
MMRVVRVLPLDPAQDLRGAPLATLPCGAAWTDGVHADHHCQYRVTHYRPAAPMKDGWVEDHHDGPHRCACGMTKERSYDA